MKIFDVILLKSSWLLRCLEKKSQINYSTLVLGNSISVLIPQQQSIDVATRLLQSRQTLRPGLHLAYTHWRKVE